MCSDRSIASAPTAPEGVAKASDNGTEQVGAAGAVDLLTGNIGYLINRAALRCYQSLARRLPPEMSPARLTALSMIGSNPGMNQTELGAMLDIANPSVVRVVNALEGMGYVLRTPIDRRSYALTLTELGGKELGRTRELVQESEEEVLSDLSSPERSMLLLFLQRVADKDPRRDPIKQIRP